MPTTSVSTPIPAGMTDAQAVAAVQNHEVMIHALAPEIISYKMLSGDPKTKAVYEVTDRKPIGQTTYKLTITNVAGGVDTLVNANPPVGTLTIAGKWRVANGKLQEDVDIDGNFVMKRMAKGNVDKTHPSQHVKLLAGVKA